MIRKKLYIYTISIMVSIFSSICVNNTKVLAAVENTNYQQNIEITENQGENTYNVDSTTATNNMLSSAGITNRIQANKYLNVTTRDGQTITKEYLQKNSGKSVTDYATISYKNDSTSQGLSTAFGTNGVGLNNFLNKYGDLSSADFAVQVQKLNDAQKVYSYYANSIDNSSSSTVSNGSATMNGMSLALKIQNIIENKGNNITPEQLEKLEELYNDVINNGGDPDYPMPSPQDMEFAIEKAGQDGKDAVVSIKPNTRLFRYVTRVRFSITDKNTGEPVDATPNFSKTQALFAQYNSIYNERWMNATGQSVPNIKVIGSGIYEMDFETPIKATSNPWKNILDTPGWQVTGADPSASDFAAVGDFTLTPSSRTLQVKIDVIGNVCTAIEKITDATYPTGKTDVPGRYAFNKYDSSYETGNYISGFNRKNGSIKESYGKVPNRVMEREEMETDDKTEYSTKEHINMPFHSNKYNFTGSVHSQQGADIYKTWDEDSGDDKYYAKDSGYGYQIMDSTYDGEYCRDIKFKVAKVRHWDYRDDLVLGAEAYPSNGASGTRGNGDIGAAVMQRYKLSDAANVDLVTFDRNDTSKVESNVVNGYCKVKETHIWRQPDKVEEATFATATWTLSPLEGEIQIPPQTRQGNMQGVINGANNEIAGNKNIQDITNSTKGE
ncbi:hypothetical protein [Clostridium sp. C2-6-12]|uniref:hypothetical protein n=1 Tax=Clostridium sp. C2-6-12 TaxID=2698832 RepID=UPI00136C3D50|nr:hypothetical protein [Clostridium sp. C2-6-12]